VRSIVFLMIKKRIFSSTDNQNFLTADVDNFTVQYLHFKTINGKDTVLSQCLSPPRGYKYKGVRANLMLGVNLRWTSVSSRGE